MKKFIFVILFALASVNLAEAKTVYCTNCSTRTTQAIEKATSIDQLKTLAKQYAEEMEQTEAQLRMVQQNIEQYANMLQNTKQLGPNLRAKLKDSFVQIKHVIRARQIVQGVIDALVFQCQIIKRRHQKCAGTTGRVKDTQVFQPFSPCVPKAQFRLGIFPANLPIFQNLLILCP